jgi:hypothetical protein
MITGTPRPLPDCALCGQPVRRRTHRTNHGMCTTCAHAYAAREHAEQLGLPLITDPPAPRAPDLSNVIVLDTRRGRTP